jgi:hypothetical protein
MQARNGTSRRYIRSVPALVGFGPLSFNDSRPTKCDDCKKQLTIYCSHYDLINAAQLSARIKISSDLAQSRSPSIAHYYSRDTTLCRPADGVGDIVTYLRLFASREYFKHELRLILHKATQDYCGRLASILFDHTNRSTWPGAASIFLAIPDVNLPFLPTRASLAPRSRSRRFYFSSTESGKQNPPPHIHSLSRQTHHFGRPLFTEFSSYSLLKSPGGC